MAEPKLDERAIFNTARRLQTPADRDVYLKMVCGNDRCLHERIIDLLRGFEDGKSFLESPLVRVATTVDVAGATEGVGGTVGPYKLREQIGEGGMGEVYVAEQAEPIRRKVALKIIRPGMATKDVLARFEAERQALAMMDHPNIAKVFDGGATESGQPYFVMELVQGPPITEYCDQQRLDTRQRLALFVKVCRAVQHAHQKGMIHRDLKPSNILVPRIDGAAVPKVIDFGIAKAVGQKLTEHTVYTQFSQMVGTPLYMSPEQAELGVIDIDTRSDVYSLGVLLYELLTGQTPFDSETLKQAGFDEMRRIIREDEPPQPSKRISTLAHAQTTTVSAVSAAAPVDSPQQRQPGRLRYDLKSIAAVRQTEPRKLSQLLRGELDWIVTKALEKDRTQRYQTASAFAADVLRYLHDQTVLACPPTFGYQLRKFLRRYKRSVLAASLVLLALASGIVGTTWQMILATQARSIAVEEARQKQSALAAARRSERTATDQLLLALWNQARAGRVSRQMGQRLSSLAALVRAARIRPDERLRDEAIAALALPDVRRVTLRYSAPPGTTAVAFSRQYQMYAQASEQGIISIRTLLEAHELGRIDSGPILGDYLYFSADDRFLLGLKSGYTLCVWRLADGQSAIELPNCRAHAFSPDGRSLAVGQEGRVLRLDLETGEEINRWDLPAPAHTLAFHPQGGKLAVGYFQSRAVSVYDSANGALVASLPVGATNNQVVAWHPDGDRLAVAGSDPRIQVWSVATERKVATLEGHVQYVPTLTFHPDGSLLASHSWDGVLRLWDAATGRPLLQLSLAVAARPRFSDDGRWLGVAVGGEHADLLEVTPSREYRTLFSSADSGRPNFGAGDISPDGRLLAVAMNEGTRLWDLPSGQELAALPKWTSFVHFDASIGAGRSSVTPADSRQQAEGLPHLLTCGEEGLLRWPITSEGAEFQRLRLGPPRRLTSSRRAAFNRGTDGRTLAAATQEGGANQIVDLEKDTVRRELGSHPSGEVRALSPDGRWAASCGWRSDRVRLWSVDTGQMIHEWVVGTRNFVFFTPDSRTLCISRSDEYSFWDVETFQLVRRLRRDVALYPGHVAFSQDGQLMALEMAPAAIHLKEVATGRTVARLEDPHGDRATWQGFTPDGSQLVVVAGYSTAIHIWDLRAIRARLKEMNLDWDWPEFPQANRQSPIRPETIEVDFGDLSRPLLAPEEHWRASIERGRQGVENNPESASCCNALAWTLVTAPPRLRNVEEGLTLAERAVRLDSEEDDYRNTLGVAYYRAERYREAVQTLQPNLATQSDEALAFDLYFLAMSHHQLGDSARAREFYDWAVRWTAMAPALSAGDAEVLSRFRAEAEELLGSDRSESK